MTPTGPDSPGGAGAPAEPVADIVGATTGASVLTGGLWHSASILLPHVFTLVVSVAAARTLGADGMGEQSFIAFVELSLVTVVTGGLSTSLVRYIGEAVGGDRADAVRSLVRWAWRIEILGGIAGGGVLLVIAQGRGELRTAWSLAALGCVAGVMHAVPTAVLIGLQRWRQAATVGLLTGIPATFATVVVLAEGGGIAGMFAVELAAGVLNLAWTARLARRALDDLTPLAASAPDLQARLLRYAAYCFVDALLSLIVWKRSEFVFLERYSRPSQLGFYSVGFAAVAALGRLPAAFGIVVTPAFATLFGSGATERIRSGFGRATRMLLLLSLPITGAAIGLGPTLLRVVYGDEYDAAGVVLLVLMLSFPAVAVLNGAEALMTSFGLVRVPLLVGVGGAVLNVGLDIGLIPHFDAVGAAAANAATQAAVAVVLVGYAAKLVGGVRWELRSLALMAVVGAGTAGAAATVVAAGLDDVPTLLLGLVAEAVAAITFMLCLRPIARDDAEWLVTVGGRFVRPWIHLVVSRR